MVTTTRNNFQAHRTNKSRFAVQAHLSERNVVELVSKLKALGLLGNDLLYTTNGREYVTRQALETEVEDLVHKEHRVSVVRGLWDCQLRVIMFIVPADLLSGIQ